MSRASGSRRGRARFRALLAGLLGAVLLLTGSWPAPAAKAEDDDTSTLPPRLVVTPSESVVPVNAEQYVFEVLLQNPGDTTLEAGELTLWLDGVRAESRAHLSAEVETREPALLASRATPQTPAGGEQEFVITVPRSQVPVVSTREAGVYLLRAELTLDASATDPTAAAPLAEATTPFVWGGVAGDPLPLTMIVPLVLPDEISGVPTASQLNALAPKLMSLFDAGEDQAATFAVDPRIIVAVRGLGGAAPDNAAQLLARLESTSNPVFLLQFADADPAVQAALDFTELLQPLGFDYVTANGVFEQAVPQVVPPERPSLVELEAKVPGDGVPTQGELLSLANARPGAWPAESQVDSGTLTLLADAGLTSVVLASSNVESATATRATLGEFETLIADDALADAAGAVLTGDTAIERQAARTRLAALTALDAHAGAGGAILALDRGTIADATDPLAVFAALEGLPWVQTVPEGQQPEGVASLRAGGSGEDRRERLRAIMNRSTQVDAMAPLLVRPDYLLQYERARLLDTFATRYATPDINFAEVDEQVRDRDRELLAGVRPVATESVQLVGASSRVPVTLRNWLPFDAAVQVRAAPLSAAVSVPERRFEAVIPPGGTESLQIPVHSRVSSGQSGLLLEVHDAGGEHLFAEEVLPLTLRTAVETMLLSGLGVAAALLFGFGIWRSLARRRQSRRE